MSTTVALRDVVGETQQVLVEAVVPLQRDFYTNPVIALYIEVEHFVDRRLVGVQVFDERTQTAFVFEGLVFA
ncbi:hypothetical protein D9M71_312680 [compost metagenome]